MNKPTFKAVHRSDYQPPEFLVETIDLVFRLDENKTHVVARSRLTRNEDRENKKEDLVLYGEKLELVEVQIDGETVDSGRLLVTENELQIVDVPDSFDLQITTIVNPEANTSLSGLYLSSSIFCTQCEAEGFRRITYYPDRPDVLARFSTRIEADRKRYPVLLSNGNLEEEGELAGGLHFAQWRDPFPKPSYLFALVAGDLVVEQDSFTTKSGRQVDLFIYTEPRNQGTCGHAMQALKKSMSWDEEVFGLEYDLDRYMIVAVDDFNMGAMENKGLNVFNSKYVLASPETATDQDYLNIEGVIAHEYFHNWTGNRVTCRDWFQLSLKEGLTVFRDQEFSADMNSRAVQRIKDVRVLRQYQFREDEGPMAHPVRPDTYMEINNFYTVTVYNKGAEVVRMIHTLIGAENFRKGMDLYFARHDGQAVTCDDFVAAMADASGRDLGQFKRWYAQAGTPEVELGQSFSEDGTLSLTLRQRTPETAGQPEKLPFHIPVLVGFLDPEGRDMVNDITTEYEKRGNSILLELTEPEQTFEFKRLQSRPIVSLLRSFSAPVKLNNPQDFKTTTLLMAADSDLFNRWDASFSLSQSLITDLVNQESDEAGITLDEEFVQAARALLTNDSGDDALTALALQLPDEAYLALSLEGVDPDRLHHVRSFVKKELASRLGDEFLRVYEQKNDSSGYSISPEAIGERSLKNTCLDYLLSAGQVDPDMISLAENQYYQATNMTDQIAVLSTIAHLASDTRETLFSHFENKWREHPLVLDKWFTMQALSSAEDTFDKVTQLLEHSSFSLKNPNKVRALIGAFCQNHLHFHDLSGRGYDFLVDMVMKLDGLNPQIAARMTNPLISWKRYEPRRQKMMIDGLKRIQNKRNLSRDVYEIVNRGLAGS
ncbi:MAG: aminopeptidase N [Desulfofustis sp.]